MLFRQRVKTVTHAVELLNFVQDRIRMAARRKIIEKARIPLRAFSQLECYCARAERGACNFKTTGASDVTSRFPLPSDPSVPAAAGARGSTLRLTYCVLFAILHS
jgi:hypothetical protein